MTVDELRDAIIVDQKKGLPFITTSVIIWTLIAIVSSLNIAIDLKNILVFCCAVPLLPIAWLIGKKMGVDIFAKGNELGNLGLLFTLNQVLYLLIVGWVFNAVPDKMVMVFAMVFGAHLLPYSWLYKSNAYKIFAILIPILSLILGNLFPSNILAITLAVTELIFVFCLRNELKAFTKQ
jgi:hypothetical protein